MQTAVLWFNFFYIANRKRTQALQGNFNAAMSAKAASASAQASAMFLLLGKPQRKTGPAGHFQGSNTHEMNIRQDR
jgi:hypothetical protein